LSQLIPGVVWALVTCHRSRIWLDKRHFRLLRACEACWLEWVYLHELLSDLQTFERLLKDWLCTIWLCSFYCYQNKNKITKIEKVTKKWKSALFGKTNINIWHQTQWMLAQSIVQAMGVNNMYKSRVSEQNWPRSIHSNFAPNGPTRVAQVPSAVSVLTLSSRVFIWFRYFLVIMEAVICIFLAMCMGWVTYEK